MFTERYIKLPIRIYDKSLKDLTGSEDSEDSYMMLDPFQIASYRPTFDEVDKERNEITVITTKSGDTTLVYLTINNFENLLNKKS